MRASGAGEKHMQTTIRSVSTKTPPPGPCLHIMVLEVGTHILKRGLKTVFLQSTVLYSDVRVRVRVRVQKGAVDPV